MRKEFILFIFIIFSFSCIEDKDINSLSEIKHNFILESDNIEESAQELKNINCYIFKDSLLHRVIHNITLDNNNGITLDIPQMANLYFLANMEEPISFASLENGKTHLSSFLSMHSNELSDILGNVPAFYSGVTTTNCTSYNDVSTKVKLSSSVSKINIDTSSDELIQIDSIEICDAPLNTRLFINSEPINSLNKKKYLQYFKPAISGIVYDIFRVYESCTPVNFTIKGTYNQIPIIINKSIPKLERNITYTIKIENKDIEIIPTNNVHILTPDSRGRLNMLSTQASLIQPGSTIFLMGNFLSVRIIGLRGTVERPIRITNYPGKILKVGDPNWAGGGGSSAIQLLECQHIVLGGENNLSDFNVEGSVQSNVQSAYFGVNLRPFTDNVEVKNMTIRNGGTGIIAKTDPEKDKPET